VQTGRAAHGKRRKDRKGCKVEGLCRQTRADLYNVLSSF
jgi:hypothetical protein